MKFLLIILLTLSSCSLFSGNNNKKEDACDWPPGNRNYSWRIDTVGYWPSEMGGLYVFNDTTAFLTGYINAKNGDNLAGLRWNGTAWIQDIYSPLPEHPIGHYGLDAAGDDSIMVSVGYWDLNNGFKSAIGEFNLNTKSWTKYQFETIGRLNSVWTDGKGFYVAVGDNGVIYTKESPNSDWVFSILDSEYNNRHVVGISKDYYILIGYKSLVGGASIDRIWNVENDVFTEWFNSSRDSNLLNIPNVEYLGRLALFHCELTDSVSLFVSGNYPIKVEYERSNPVFTITNLNAFVIGETNPDLNYGWVFGSQPNDIWIPKIGYGLYHYNGLDLTKIISIPNLPYGSYLGVVKRMFFMESGKIWMLMESDSQQYLLIQGTPL